MAAAEEIYTLFIRILNRSIERVAVLLSKEKELSYCFRLLLALFFIVTAGMTPVT